MAEIVRMPKLSDTMTEGVVAEWHKKVGEQVETGEVLAEIETDKATMEFESFQDGVLLHIGVDKGATAAVDSILAILGEAGEDVIGPARGRVRGTCRGCRPCANASACSGRTNTCSGSPCSSSSGSGACCGTSGPTAFFKW